MKALPGLAASQIQAKVKEFTSLGLFEMDPFKVMQKHFLENLGHGPERK